MNHQEFRKDSIATTVVVFCVLQNFFLSIVNQNVIGLGPNHVVIVQTLLSVIAILLAGWYKPKLSRSYSLIVIATFALALFPAISRLGIDPKGLYNISLVFVFTALGASIGKPRFDLIRAIVWIAFGVAVFEIVFPTIYISVVNPLGYFLSTREWVSEFLTGEGKLIGDEGLYVGAVRPGEGSKFSFTDHRVGSIFLEPISLAYFSIICLLFNESIFSKSRMQRIIGVATLVFLIVASDTRTMAATFLLISFFLLIPIGRYTKFYVLLPIAIFTGASIFSALNSSFGSELSYRLSLTTLVLYKAGPISALLGEVDLAAANDSGFIVLVSVFGFVGALLFFYAASGVLSAKSRNAIKVTALASAYLLIGSLFGGALFSIKTSSLLGFLIGHTIRTKRSEPSRGEI